MSTVGDPLNNEVVELLQRTDNLVRSLRSSTSGERTPSETARSDLNSLRASLFSRGRPGLSSVFSSTELESGEALLETAARVRGSFADVSQKLTEPSEVRKSQSVDILKNVTHVDNDAPTPRLLENPGCQPSAVLTDNSSAFLGQSGPTSLDLSLQGGSKSGVRAYNSFGDLHEMVSLVDALAVPASPAPSAPAGPAMQGSRPSFTSGPFAGSGGKGTLTAMAADLKPVRSMRSPSRLGSPGLSPRSPLHRSSSLSAAHAAAPSARGSRRAQLQSLLSKDIAQPQDVLRFKAEVKNLMQPPVSVTQLAGDLQEKFDRVNRKLKNWSLIETAATERFNAAMDAALEALFSRINLSWPSEEQPPTGASDSSTGIPSTSAYDSLRSRADSKSGRTEPALRESRAQKDADYVPHRRRHGSYGQDSSRRADDADEAGYGSPSSSASQRYGWEEDLSTTTDAEENASGGSMRHGASKASRTRSAGKGRGAAPGQRGDTRREAPPRSSARDHDAADPHATGRMDPRDIGRRAAQPHSGAAAPGTAGAGQHAPHPSPAWHAGSNGVYLTGHHSGLAPPHASASAPYGALGVSFPVPNATAMLGIAQPPYMSLSAAYTMPPPAPVYQMPLAAVKSAGGGLGAQHYGASAAVEAGLSAPSMGARPQDAQPTDPAWKLGMDAVCDGPFASSGLWTQPYRGSTMPTNPIYGAHPTSSANDSSGLLFRPEQGPIASAASYIAPATGRNGPAHVASSELCASASTAALHSIWQASSAHSAIPTHGPQESSASGPVCGPPGFDAGAFALPAYKSAYSFAPMATGANAQTLAYASIADLIGNTGLSGRLQHVAGGHITYGAAGPVERGQEHHAAGQYLRYASH